MATFTMQFKLLASAWFYKRTTHNSLKTKKSFDCGSFYDKLCHIQILEMDK